MAQLPRWSRRIVEVLLPKGLAGRIVEDLREEWPRQLTHRGALGARIWLARMVTGSVWSSGRSALSDLRTGRIPSAGLRGLLVDLKVARRRLLATPFLTGISAGMLSLALGGAAAFSVLVDELLLHPLPFDQASRIVEVRTIDPSAGLTDPLRGGVEVTAAQLPALRESGAFSQVAPWGWDGFGFVEVGGVPIRVAQARVGPGTGAVFAVAPIEGRWFTDAEAKRAEALVVLSFSLRQQLFAGEAEVVGRTLQLNGSAHEVVGVLPAGLRPHDAELWTPLSPDAESFWVFARLAPGVDLDEADRRVAAVSDALRKDGVVGPYQPDSFRFAVLGAEESARSRIEGPVRLLGAGIAGLLLLTALNLTALVLVRALDGAREGAVRGALGASASGRIRPVIVEVLGLVGGGLLGALLLTGPALRLLLGVLPAEAIGPQATPEVDASVLAVACFGSVVLAVALCWAAGAAARRVPLNAVLATGGRGGLRSRSRMWLDGFSLAAQTGLAFALLGTALLTSRSFLALESRDPGFEVAGLTSHAIALPPEADERDRVRLARRIESRAEEIPGVTGASVSWVGLPELGGVFRAAAGRSSTLPDQALAVGLRSLGTTELEVAGVGVLRGRPFGPEDDMGSEPVALVNESAAAGLFGNSDPVGATVTVERSGEVRSARIVGVVPDLRLPGAAGDPRPEVFLPYPQWPQRFVQLLVRSSVPPPQVQRSVARVVGGVIPGAGVRRWVSLEEAYRAASGTERGVAMGLLAFALLALALVVTGIVGAAARWVRTRRREHAIRVALGARTRDLVGRAVMTVLQVAGLGVAAGVGLFVTASGWIEGVLYGVPALDLPSLVIAAIGLAAAVAVATLAGMAMTDWGRPGQLLSEE